MSSQLQGLQSQGIDAAWIGPLTGGSSFHSADLKDAPNLPFPTFSYTQIFGDKNTTGIDDSSGSSKIDRPGQSP